MDRAPVRPFTLGLLSLAALAGGCGGGPASTAGPDVLLVTIDTLRADHLGAYGSDLPTSPEIDRLAAEGVIFLRAIAASPSTVPSHATIMTSRHPRGHSVGYGNGNTRLEDAITLADHFRAAGYRTAAFLGNAILKRRVGLDRGFDVYDDDLPTPEANRERFFERDAPTTTQRAVEWLEPESGPVFLWVHYQDPHGPYTPPAELAARFEAKLAGEARPAGEAPLPVLERDGGFHGIPAYQVLGDLRLPSEYRSRYAGEIFFADRGVGALAGGVRAHAARTGGRGLVLLLTADHGESLGEGDRWFSHSHSATPELAHVPLLLVAPGLAPDRRSELVGHVDVLPTLLDLAGLPVPDDAHGVALGAVARGEAVIPDRTLYCDIGSEVGAYRGDAFLRIRGIREASASRLRGDPGVAPIWSRYRWSPGTNGRAVHWERDPAGEELPEEILSYLGNAVRMSPADDMGPEDIARLRVLGYLDAPGSEEAGREDGQ